MTQAAESHITRRSVLQGAAGLAALSGAALSTVPDDPIAGLLERRAAILTIIDTPGSDIEDDDPIWGHYNEIQDELIGFEAASWRGALMAAEAVQKQLHDYFDPSYRDEAVDLSLMAAVVGFLRERARAS